MSDGYGEWVAKAYIDPIRSVLVVDDDWPTYDEILRPESDPKDARTAGKAWRRTSQDRERIRAIIEQFRTRTPPLVVDIHDGANVSREGERTVAEYLHQSDLLILDYQLNRARQDDGSDAIGILRRIMKNKHFNLVVIYTNTPIGGVFQNVTMGMIGPWHNEIIRSHEKEEAVELIEARDDVEAGFEREISKSVDRTEYLEFRRRGSVKAVYGDVLQGKGPYARFHGLCDGPGWGPEEKKVVFRHLLATFEEGEKRKDAFNPSPPKGMLWSEPGATVQWLRCDSAFVAFTSKGGDVIPGRKGAGRREDLIAELKSALVASEPEPSRLFLARQRAEIDEYGIAAQEPVLGSKHALALWYRGLLEADEETLRERVGESVRRHSEQLMEAIVPNVTEFALELVRSESGEPRRVSCQRFGVDLGNSKIEEQALKEHNALVGCKPPSGRHLTTGHIFEFELGKGVWVCLSPACDLVPDQRSKEDEKMFGDWLPFVAVELRRTKDGTALKGANSGRFVFLPRSGKIECFGFNEQSDSAPKWRIFYAGTKGVFERSQDDERGFDIMRVAPKQGALQTTSHRAVVVGQLRYEYALNLSARLGASLTRVGLEFQGKSEP